LGVKDGSVALALGYLRFGAQDYKGATEALNTAETAGEKDDNINVVRGKAFYEEKNYPAAIADLEKAVTQNKADLTGYEGLALSYMATQKEKEALPLPIRKCTI
jgi:predicted Zn-dependent protease